MDLLKEVECQEIAAKEFGFYWESIEQLIEQIVSECREIEEAYRKGDKRHLQEELGDLMGASISIAIFCGFCPSETLKYSIDKFQKRYDALVELVKQDGKKNLKNHSLDVLMDYWKKAKTRVNKYD